MNITQKFIKNPVTGKRYKVVERKTSESTIQSIKDLWKPSKRKHRKIYW